MPYMVLLSRSWWPERDALADARRRQDEFAATMPITE